MAVNLNPLKDIDGFLGAALVDAESSMVLGTLGGGKNLDLEIASAGNSEVVRAKRKTMQLLQLDDVIEDILISLGEQYHLIRPLAKNGAVFLYLAVQRRNANLAMARVQLRQFEQTLDGQM